jgi:hypothetical protein
VAENLCSKSDAYAGKRFIASKAANENFRCSTTLRCLLMQPSIIRWVIFGVAAIEQAAQNVLSGATGDFTGTLRRYSQQVIEVTTHPNPAKTANPKRQELLTTISRSPMLPSYKQEVAGSSPALPTILRFVFRSAILLRLHQSDVANGAVRVTVRCLDHQPVADHSQPLRPAVLQPIGRN